MLDQGHLLDLLSSRGSWNSETLRHAVSIFPHGPGSLANVWTQLGRYYRDRNTSTSRSTNKVRISAADRDRILHLVQEGKALSKIVEEDFPDLDYWEVYWAACEGGERSARGVKRMITKRLNLLVKAGRREDRQMLIDEIGDLVSYLYENHKKNSEKINKIRKALNS